MIVKFKKLTDDAVTPTYGSDGAAAFDLYANEDVNDRYNRAMIHTGIALEIPRGYVGLVFPRSGLATKKGLRLQNSVGVIDSDYRGEIMVGLHNDLLKGIDIHKGDRIAQ